MGSHANARRARAKGQSMMNDNEAILLVIAVCVFWLAIDFTILVCHGVVVH
jgi:hypothetical protein